MVRCQNYIFLWKVIEITRVIFLSSGPRVEIFKYKEIQKIYSVLYCLTLEYWYKVVVLTLSQLPLSFGKSQLLKGYYYPFVTWLFSALKH